MRKRLSGGPGRQRGAALIALAAALVLGTSWAVVSTLGNLQGQRAVQVSRDSQLLRETKETLIAYVASRAIQSNENSPGRLPCPEDPAFTSDLNAENDGVAAATCTLPAVGRLPWRTLGIAKPIDFSGEPLWYVVSAGWAIPTAATSVSLNSNTLGQLTVDGASPAAPSTSNTVAALIIAPGAPLTVAPTANQMAAGCASRTQRRGTMPPDLRDYLECENATSPANATFVTTVVENASNPVLNDRIVSISPAEIFDKAEASIAARIEREVMSNGVWGLLEELRSYAQDTVNGWATSASQPVYPFAAPFSNPATSDWKGSAGTTQGLLPLTRSSSCSPGGDCDPSFVRWNTASITITKVSGTPNITSTDCAASSATQISCDVTYLRTGCGFFSSCTTGTIEVRLASSAQNVGMGFKMRPNTVPVPTVVSSSWTSATTPTKASLALDTNGAVPLTYQGTLQSATCPAWSFGFCQWTRTVRVTLPTFADHSVLNPSTSDAWWWFRNSNWHHLVYYVLAPNHSPSGAVHACTTGADCLNVTNLSPAGGQRAVLVFAGRTLTGLARPNGTLTDHLDNVNVAGVAASINQDGNSTFHKAGTNPIFNDRFITVDSN